MKKSLLAVSVLSALASVAQAQNISVYGVMDGTVAGVKSGTFSNSVVLSGGHSTSRLGFRGSEDLGGGLRANFELEGGLAIDVGAMGGASGATSANTAGSSTIFSRGSWVGLQGGFGSIQIGKISTHANAFLLGYIAGGNYNVISYRNALTGLTGWRDNSINYVTPTINGFTGRIMHTTGNVTATGNEGTTDANKGYGKGTEFGLSYAAGPLAAGVYQAKLAIGSSTVEEMSKGFGARYNLGFATVGAVYTTYDPSDAASNDQRKGLALSINYPMSPTITLVGFTGNVSQENGGGTNEIKTRYSSVGADYALSKRTTAYAFFVKAANNANGKNSLGGLGATGTNPQTGAVSAVNSSPLPEITAGDDPQAWGVGIRHSF